MYFFYLTPILLRLFQQHYCYNVTGQSQESEASEDQGSTFQTTFVPGFAVYTHSYSFNTDICLHIHSTECTVRYNPKYVGNTGNRTRDI